LADFLDAFMTYGAILAMAVLVISRAVALLRGIVVKGRKPPSPGAGSEGRGTAADPGEKG